jgi:RimJ/RimL family protein N-acetyltransferase
MSIILQEIRIPKDLELIFYWRQNPLIFSNFLLQTEPLNWNDHLTYWEGSPSRIDWFIVLGDRRIGSVYFKIIDSKLLDIGIYIADINMRGKGIGNASVVAACKWASENGFVIVNALILNDNTPSIKMFNKCGFLFNRTYETDSRFSIYTLKL